MSEFNPYSPDTFEIPEDSSCGKPDAAPVPSLPRRFVREGTDVFDSVPWDKRSARLTNAQTGEDVFSAKNLTFPRTWSQNATNLVAEKYFRNVEQPDGSFVRETSVRQMISRIVETIADWGVQRAYFDSEGRKVFRDELAYILLHQMASFNSPVWFNVGTKLGRIGEEQCSACFINSVEDNMQSILQLAETEGTLYKGGSGSGVNYSALRSSRERLSGGGFASGPVPFIAKDDTNAGAVKSGGTTRRAAKMALLDVDHGDILEFIEAKAGGEKAAQVLIDSGVFKGDFRERWGAYAMVPFQNANHSVRVTDEFMLAVVGNDEWNLLARDGTCIETLQARDIWDAICTAAWECGDPGLQFDTTINRWHTSPAHGRINGSNPCQPATATVLTPDGIRTFADIDVGSIIWSGERWTRVTHKIPTGKKPVYRFITRAGVFVGTEDHRVVEENTKIAIKDATTVRTSQGACPEPCVFDPQAVIDGMVLGDGSMIHANGGANQYPVLYIGDGDQCYFEASHGVAEFINSEPYEVKCHRVNTTLTAEDLPKTYERRVPKSYLEGDSRVTRSFLRGLYTANGSICGNRVTLKASSLAVTEGVQQMLSSIGIRSYYTINKAHEVEFENGTYLCRESYNLNISTDRGLFRALIGFIHPHKGERLDNICEVRSVSSRGPKLSYEIVDREFLGCVPVYDITVEAEEHTYWTGGLLVSNCSEYMFLDDTACNLASINLLKFLDDDFLIGDFRHTVDVLITAMDIIVGAAGYPTPKITENSHKFRTLGLGYSNLGAYLQAQGVAYDSEEGRMQAASITAILSGRGYACSSHLAARLGAFAGFEVNRGKMLSIMRQHRDAAVEIEDQQSVLGSTLKMHAEEDWTRCITLGEQYAYRNAQISVIAPAGTISFMMDCDTTGIEPELSLRKTKKLVGGGTLQIVNQQVARALDNLGYDINQIEAIEKYIEEHNSVVGAPGIQNQHLGVFDTSFPEGVNGRHISPRAHVRMMGAVQPFVSGAISKTVNLPANTTVEEIGEIYMFAWERGLKSVALYRDGCKRTQPLTADGPEAVESATAPAPLQLRRKLPNDCLAHRHHFEIGNQSGYLHVGLYPDGKPGELFVTMAKEGSTVSGLVDAIGVLTSIALQYGVPLGVLVDKFSYTNFEPAGITNNSEIRFAQSPLDYIFRFMGLQFLQDGAPEAPGEPAPIKEISSGGQTCTRCGNGLQRAGSCLTCSTCGWSEGCG